MYHQEPPFAVQVELTEGCNLRCAFCGVNGIRGKERTYRYMTTETAEAIASQMAAARWNARVEFAMHGEPTMHRGAEEIIAIFRRHLPRASFLMLSNGGGLTVDRISAILDAGINTLGLDEYQNISLVPRLLEQLRGQNEPRDFAVLTYPDDPDANPHHRQHPRSRRVVHIRPIDLSSHGSHSTLTNHCGAGAPENDRGVGKRCAKPFRELSFRYDGCTAVCCNDWRGELATGSIHAEGLDGIWNGEIMATARRRLYAGRRDFGPCQGCDAPSYRVGFLPDKMGRDTLEPPEDEVEPVLREAALRAPLAAPVLREWER